MSQSHKQKVKSLQQAIHDHLKAKSSAPLAISNKKAPSNITRGKRYKIGSSILDFESLDDVLEVNVEERYVIAEPRVTMEKLLAATLPFGLAPAVLPEFKGITVGGAIMGGAAESGSFRWGCFNDICISHELLTGNGDLLTLSPTLNRELYFGIAGSYGSLGALVSSKITLIPVPLEVTLDYQFCTSAEAIDKLQKLCHSIQQPLFVDGLILSKELAVIITADKQKSELGSALPLFSFDSLTAPWYFQHVTELAEKQTQGSYQERMSIKDYFFRYDLGAFWMGAFLFRLHFLGRFIYEGLLGRGSKKRRGCTSEEIQWLHPLRGPSSFYRTLLKPFMGAQSLWRILHQAELWCQEHLFIQDFCIPEGEATQFCCEEIERLGIYPVWLCPIKGTREEQLFAPHYLQPNQIANHLINFGLYGIPSLPQPISEITHECEHRVFLLGGRKVFYSQSLYTLDEFWAIYPRLPYEKLRDESGANGVWVNITDKVLSD